MNFGGRIGAALLATTALLVAGCEAVTPRPTPTPPLPPLVRPLPGRGVTVEGQGTQKTEMIAPDQAGGLTVGIAVVTLTHDGRSSFIVRAQQGQQTETITQAIGAYRGERPLVVQGAVAFDITADGAWTLRVQPLGSGAMPPFNGTGDMVSRYFTPPAPGTWDITYDGSSSFFVYAHCVGGSVVVIDKAGPVKDEATLRFPRGPCFWEVRADDAWSLQPRATTATKTP